MSDRVLLATFEHEDDLLAATDAVRRNGFRIVDAFTPYAVHGLERRGPFRIRPIQPDPGNLAVVAWLERDGKVVQAVTIDVEQMP